MAEPAERPLAPFALSVLVLTGVLQGGAVSVDAGLSQDDASVVLLRVGDRFHYVRDDNEAHLEVSVGPQRNATAANLTRVASIPLVVDLRTQSVNHSEAYVIDRGTGDLVFIPDTCLVDANLSCDEGSHFLSWGECPLDGFFGPGNYVTFGNLDDGEFVVEDPVKGTRFRYAVDNRSGTVRLDLVDEVPRDRTRCGLWTSATLDLKDRVVTHFTIDQGDRDMSFSLAEMSRGDGPTVRFGNGPSRPSRLVPPDSPREDLYPSGFGDIGPAPWTLGEAVDRARAEWIPLRMWLQDNPDAFLYRASKTEVQSITLRHVTADTYRWRFDVLSPQGEMVRITTQKTVYMGQIETTNHEMENVPLPEEVPDGFRPPSSANADIQRVVTVLHQRGYGSVSDWDPRFHVSFDGADADYKYAIITSTERSESGGEVASGWFKINGDTGRVTDAVLPTIQARNMVG